MSNLPPGVTDAMIDQYFGGARDDWPDSLTCDHEVALGELWDALEAEGLDDPGTDSRYIALDTAPTEFTDKTAEVSSWTVWQGAECTWICPVCGVEHEESINNDDFSDG